MKNKTKQLILDIHQLLSALFFEHILRKIGVPFVVLSFFLCSTIPSSALTIANTYVAGDIPTNATNYDPTCNGPATPLTVLLPAGGPWLITSLDVEYDMTAATGAWMSEQRSRLYCQNTTAGEIGFTAGTGGNSIGTENYIRTGLNIANGVYAGGTNLVFEMQAFRTWAGAGTCNPTYNRIDDGSWTVTITYEAAVPMTYVSSTCTQTNTNNVEICELGQEIIGLEIITNGTLTPIDITQLRLRSDGSTNPTGDITNINVYYSGTNATFATGTLFGSATSAATGIDILINGTQTLAAGTNYFWVTYDLNPAGTVTNLVDAICNQTTINGSNYVPILTNPPGSRTISPCVGPPSEFPNTTSSIIIPCGTNTYSATGTPGNGGTDIEWFSDYLGTTSIGIGTTYNGTSSTSSMLYAKSKNGGTYSADPAQIFIFKPQAPNLTYTQSSSCNNGASISIQVDTIPDSLTTIVLEDVTIDPGNPNTNYNNDFLVVRPQGFCGGNVHFLSKYDLSVLPPSVVPFYSKSSVVAYSGFAHGGNGNVYEQHVINDTWKETTVTNTTAPMPIAPNSNAAGDHSGNWWVWYGFPSQGVAHGNSATMGASAEGNQPMSNTNNLLNQLVTNEYLGDQTMSLYHFSPGYDSRYYSKDYKTDITLLPQLQIKFWYNHASTCTYSWVGPGGFTASTKDLQNLSQNGLYTLTVTNAYGCTSTLNVNVTNASTTGPPNITNPGNIIECDSIQLPAITGTNLTAGASYYSAPNGAGTTYTVNDWVTSSMTMYIYDQVAVNCDDEEIFTITINTSPDLITPTDTCFSTGESITTTFIDNNTTGGTVTYWQNALATTPELNPTNITASGTYYIVMAANGCSDTASINVNINPTTVVPGNISYCSGDAVPASAYTSTPAGATFDWLNSNTSIGLAAANGVANTSGFTATNTSLLPDTSIISAWATLNSCPGDTAKYLIIVNPLPVALARDTLICTNNNTTLTATDPGGVYEWFDAATGGTLLHTGAAYTTPILTASTSYWVQSTINGCTGPRTKVDVTIGNGLIVDAGADVDICEGEIINLSATPTTVTNTFNWSEPGGSAIPNVFNPSVSPSDTTLYKVEITDIFGCIGIDSVTVNVKPTPVVTVPRDSVYCNGEPVPASAYTSSPIGATYTWTNSNPNVGLATLLGSSATGNPNTPVFTATNTTTQQITSTISVTPTLLNCVGNPQDYTVTVNPIPTITSFPNDETYCISDVVPASNVTGTPTSLTFNWTNSNTAIGLGSNGLMDVPSFTATNITHIPEVGLITITPEANGCVGPSVNYNITVSAPIIIDRVITDATCFGSDDGKITVIPSGGTPSYNYNWTSGDSGPNASNLPSGPVTITIIDANNCTQDSTFNIIEPDSIDYITFRATPQKGCAPLEVRFNATIDPAIHLIQNYVWDFGNNLVPQDSFVAHSYYNESGFYNVSLTVTDYSGCSNTHTINGFIEVYEDPEAHFDFTPENPEMLNPTVDFRDLSFSNIVDWEWYFDTLGNSNLQNPSFIFPEDSGTYPITLIVENENTCKDTLTKVVKVKSETAIFIPNSFTPNGDGINDVFMPKGFGVNLQNYSFLVFNRWGELIFQSNDIKNGWDGSFKGELLPSGVYVWRIDYQDLNGNNYRNKGQINILR